MDIDSIRLVIEVARQASFAGAARQRDVDPSSVSRMIAQVEAELGFRIFQRTTRSMSLTEAGERYVRRAELVLQELDAAAEEATALGTIPRGRLRATASVAFGNRCLVPLLPEFRAEFPQLQLELILTDSNLDLVSEGIDLAIRLGPGFSGDLVGAKLFDTRYRVCASSAFLRGKPRPRRPADLSAMSCLLFTFPDFRSRWLFRDRRGEITEVAVQGDLLLSNALAMRDCARAGLGPALLPDWLIDEDLVGKRLVDLFPDWQVTATTFDTAAYVLYPNRAFLPVKVRRTIDFLRRHLVKQAKRARR
ncbi:LysR substrate-binding domain-containing protein [Bradyrhizobium sp. 62B]|uniref:LysR family transcriptional regulator n=1 Tax=Bradyrhizobium sp. 62B TaxID=2898442 RepID=UPI0025581FF6|nr:LysR substrate-binding domain-containing protein [Bradyrhizobium sp. 62B]